MCFLLRDPEPNQSIKEEIYSIKRPWWTMYDKFGVRKGLNICTGYYFQLSSLLVSQFLSLNHITKVIVNFYLQTQHSNSVFLF